MKKAGVGLVLCVGLVGVGASCSRNGSTANDQLLAGKVLHMAQPERIKGLDPALAEDAYSGIEVSRTYETLLEYHYLKRPFVLIPGLAESMPEISKDGKTVMFKIKKGVLFQDDPCFKATGGKGREMTAADVVYSWKRIADPKTLSVQWMFLSNLIVGLDEWRDQASRAGKASYAIEVPGLKAVDDYTLRVELKQRSGQFLYYAATPGLSVVAREAVETYGTEFIRHPVGTGPFVLKEYNPAARLVWEKNPNFRKELYPSEGAPGDRERGLLADAGKALPLVDRLVVDVMIESQPMWLTFMKGRLDFAVPPKDSYSEAITLSKELAPELKSKGIQLQKEVLSDVTHVSFNMRDPLLGKNKKLRQALSVAFDQSEFNRVFYNDRAEQAQGPIPPNISGYDPKLKNPYRVFNIARAKQLLAEAGYKDGKGLPPLDYASVASSEGRNIATFMEKSFKEIGVQLKVSSYSWPEFLKAIKDGRSQLAGHAWAADYPDGQNFLMLFYGKNMPPNGNNDAFYSNPEYDKMYEKALTLPDGKERTALYRKMVSVLVEDCPWIFEAHRHGYYLTQPWLKNFKYHPFEHSRHKYFRVDPEIKAQYSK